MKIVLTTGIISKKKGRNSIIRVDHPPLGLGYIAAVLEKNGYEVEIYDCLPLYYSVNEVVDYILKRKPDIIGVSVMSTNYEGAREMSNLIKKKVNIPIVFGGPHCSSYPFGTMEECPDVDFLIYGEGEFIFPMLIEALSGKSGYHNIPQLCFREPSGRVIMNRREQPNQDLDIIPFPARHLFNNRLYFLNVASCVTSRGCSYGKCAFCMRTGLLYEKYRRRSVENVMSELEFLYRNFAFRKIAFLDDNFAQNEEWVIKFCDMLIQRKLKLEWVCIARVNTITKKMIKRMAEAKCVMISYGIESGNQDLLDYMSKGISIEQIKDAVRLSKEFGIRTFGFFMLALPGETPGMGKKTIQFAIDLDLDFVQFVPTRPLSGTRLYDLCNKEGKILDNSNEFYNTLTPSPTLIPKITFVPKDYKDKKAVAKIIRLAYRKFHLRYSYIWKLLKSIRNRDFRTRLIKHLLVFKRLVFYKST